MIYAIVDDNFFNNIDSNLVKVSKLANMILYRDKTSSFFYKNAKLLIENRKLFNSNKIILHSNYKLAYELKADGVHFTSKEFELIPLAKKLNLFTIASTHSIKEAEYAKSLNVDMITFSPIFSSPNKGEGVGLNRLLELTREVNIPVIALGGITTNKKIELVKKYGAIGFASIRYFNEKLY